MAVALLVGLATVGCSAGDRSGDAEIARKPPCPVTRPNGSVPPQLRGQTGIDASAFHGNGALWTRFRTAAGIRATDAYVEEEGLRAEWPWWRAVEGELQVAGQRLDGEVVELRAHVPGGYGRSGFQPSTLVFPLEGCWRITGRVGSATLTFVVLVRYVDRSP